MSGYSTPAGPVLDYASPRPRGKVRLPARSRLELHVDLRGATVREWLEAKAGAIVAMLVAVGTLAMLPATTLSESYYWRFPERYIGQFVVVGGIWVAEFILLLIVINNTWRRTTLQAQADALLLTFSAPFGRRRYEWPAAQIEQVRVESTTSQMDRNHLGELSVHIAGHPLVKLFTDHEARELERIAAEVRRALLLEAQPATLRATVPPPLPRRLENGEYDATERAAE